MKTANYSSVLERLVSTLGDCLMPESARRLLTHKAEATLQARVDDLATRRSEGRHSSAEQAEYSEYVSYGTLVAILKSKAR